MMTLTTVIEPMRVANYLAPQPLYEWDFRSPDAGPIQASNGMYVDCAPLDKDEQVRPDVIAVFGSWGAEHYDNASLSNWLRRQERTGACVTLA